MPYHYDLTWDTGAGHQIHAWEFADSYARETSGGYDSTDLKKLALQINDQTLWMLTSVSPFPVWTRVSAHDISDLVSHASSTENPHNVTIEQIGAEPVNANIQSHIISAENPHNVTATQVGLGNVDNTSDADKPISTATQISLNGKEPSIEKKTAFNKDFGTTSGTVAEGDHGHSALESHVLSTENPHNVTAAQVGLGNVDNTSDVNKPISTATQNALNGKEPSIEKKTAFNKDFGNTSGTVAEGSHNHLSNAGDFLPSADNTYSLGSATYWWKDLYAKEVHVSGSSLYVNGKQVISDVSDTMTFKTDADQSMVIQTTGLGSLSLKSGNAALSLISDSNLSVSAKGGMDYVVSADQNAKNLSFNNYSTNGQITFVANGSGGQINLTSPSVLINSYAPQTKNEKGAANGYCGLDEGGKVPIANLSDAIVGQVEYQGSWVPATNTPALPAANTHKGWYYIAVQSGTWNTISFEIGDWVISDGTNWSKVDNTDAVSTVFGRNGAIIANSGDYTASQITNTPAGGIVATDVQTALNELDSDKAATNQTMYIGTTLVAINRASGSLALTGIASIDGSSASCSGNAATATTATKVGSSTIGSSTAPVYINAGTPTACGSSLAVSITGSSASCTGNAATATVKNVDNSNETTIASGFAGGLLYVNYRGASAAITDVKVCNGLSSGATTNITAKSFTSDVATGTAPLSVTSTTAVTNLNADLLDGYHASTTATAANTIPVRDASGYMYLGWINTTSGDNGTTAPTRIYASHDGFIRYYSLANFKTVLGTVNAATLASTVTVTTTSTAGNFYIPFVSSSATGSYSLYSDTGLYYNPSTNYLYASVSGSSSSCTGNAATATTATTANKIRTAAPGSPAAGDIWIV